MGIHTGPLTNSPIERLDRAGASISRVSWLARVTAFCWVGLIAFVLFPSSEAEEIAEGCGYALVGVSLVAWASVGRRGRRGERSPGLLGVLLVMGIGSGFACAIAPAATSIVGFALLAALIAGSDLAPWASGATVLATISAMETGGLAFHAGLVYLVGLPAVVIAGLVIGLNRGLYRVRSESAVHALQHVEALRAAESRGHVLTERTRIAREIHDVLAHTLGALAIQSRMPEAEWFSLASATMDRSRVGRWTREPRTTFTDRCKPLETSVATR